MSAGRRQIKGPQSALTDFLAANNISVAEIRESHLRRRREAAEAANNQQNGESSAAQAPATPVQSPEVLANNSSPRRVTRQGSSRLSHANPSPAADKQKKETKEAVEKIKARKRKRHLDDSDAEDEDLAEFMNEIKKAPLPGQMANCDICEKRFTVTPYTRQGPDGGLLCNPCGKELNKEQPPKKKVARPSAGPVGQRRKVASAILDGMIPTGAKSLVGLCLGVLAKNIDLAEDLGDMPPVMVDKIARKLSKHRLVTSRTLDLFLTPSCEDLSVYDAAQLSSEDFRRIFQTSPKLKTLKLRNAIQFKDEVMKFLLGRSIQLEKLSLHGANLLSDDMWQKYMKQKGKSLRALQVYYTDNHFGDETLSLLPAACPSLERLKVKYNQRVTGEGIKHVGKLDSLRHLAIDGLRHSVHSDVFVGVIDGVGQKLRTLSLLGKDKNDALDNTVLDAIHRNCRDLEKLRITDSLVMTDEGFVRLFEKWENRGLVYADLSKNRQMDSVHPTKNPDGLGLCSNGFRALMAHSGRTLRHLNVHACRHITAEAFEDVFAGDKVYPELRQVEVSFCDELSDFIASHIFRACPSLRELSVYGCMKLKHVTPPRGKLLHGLPNAMGMTIEGDQDQQVGEEEV